jgi:hypothetical protein
VPRSKSSRPPKPPTRKENPILTLNAGGFSRHPAFCFLPGANDLPQRHRAHRETQRNTETPAHIANTKTRRHKGRPSGFTARRGPGRRPTAGDRRPRHSPSPFHGWDGHANRPTWKDVRRNRRASGASAGGAFGRDKRSRLEWTIVPPAGGGLRIADCSAVNLRHCRIT